MDSTSCIIDLDARRAAARSAARQLPDPIPPAQMTLADQLIGWARMRVGGCVFRVDMCMSPIRQLAQEKSISRFTVVETYERLVAQGYLKPCRGSGLYVKERQTSLPEGPVAPPPTAARKIDVTWLLRNMFHSVKPCRALGIGSPPNGQPSGEPIANALRTFGRQGDNRFLAWGSLQDSLPLCQQLQARLAELKVGARPEQIVMTPGIISPLDLITHQYVQPGNTVLVGDPA